MSTSTSLSHVTRTLPYAHPTLLFAGQPHPRGNTSKPTGKKFVPAPMKEGRNGLFGLLQGTEAGGVDSWIGNIQVRAVACCAMLGRAWQVHVWITSCI
jgi:hypothetical protein